MRARSRQVVVRLDDAELERLDEKAAQLGVQRSVAIRQALEQYAPDPRAGEPFTRGELLRLLGVAARRGSVPAARLLLRETRDDRPRSDIDGVLDELAPRRRKSR